MFELYEKIAVKAGYKFIPIFLTAPDDVLIDRFRKRVAYAAATGMKITVTDENIFKSWLKLDYYQSASSKAFDTSKMEMSEIRDQVLKML